MKELTKAEELVLLTIWRMGDDAYGVAIKRKIQEEKICPTVRFISYSISWQPRTTYLKSRENQHLKEGEGVKPSTI